MTYKSDLGFLSYGSGAPPIVLTLPVILSEAKNLQNQLPSMPHAVWTAGSNSYTYDNNGNMLSAPNKLMTYDVENRLISVETSTETTLFTYDTDGSRIKKQTGTTTTTYISSLFEIETRINADGTRITADKKHIFAGANRVCTISLSPEGGEGQGEATVV